MGTTDELRVRMSNRVSSLTVSAPSAIDFKAKQLRLEGRPVITFGAGEPDFSTPEYIYEAAARGASIRENHRYTPPGGLPEFRQAVAKKTSRDSGGEIDAAQVVITNGGKQAVYNALAGVVNPGDEVLLPTPHWTTYPEAIRLVHGEPVQVFAGAAQQYRVTVEQLDAAKTNKTKALIFTSPSNPTGSVYPRQEVLEIARWAKDNGLWVITDEIYEHFTYDGAEFTSMLPELREQCIVVNGLAKAFSMTGWRVGWLVAPPAVASAITNFQSHTTGNVSNLAQRAGIAALSGDQRFTNQLREAFDRRRSLVVEGLSSIEGFRVPVPQGAFYAYPDVSEVLGIKAIRGRVPTTSLELAEILLDEADVAVVPGEAFGPSGFLRLSYALADEDLIEGIRRIKALFEGKVI